MSATEVFDSKSFRAICKKLAARDADLQSVIEQYGYPPMWTRPASFETLIHIILEQQVSLASALAALNKLKEKIIDITPENVLALSDQQLRDCYFSRQKIIYARHLAVQLNDGQLDLQQLSLMDNDTVRATLTKIKGIGNWSTDVYLMMVLQRSDVFPLGDVALITSMRQTKQLAKEITKEQVGILAKKWQPYQTIAAFILWHAYLSRRIKK